MVHNQSRTPVTLALAVIVAAQLWMGVAHAAAGMGPGEQLFAHKCGICHAAGGTGAIMLGLRLGKDHAVLAVRTDLQAPYIAAIVRMGLRSMPPLTRVEVTDAQLQSIVGYLTRDNPPAEAAESR